MSARRRRQAELALTELMATGHAPLEAVSKVEPRAGALVGKVRRLRGALEQEGIDHFTTDLLSPEVLALLKAGCAAGTVPQTMSLARDYLGALKQLFRSCWLSIIYPLTLLYVLWGFCFFISNAMGRLDQQQHQPLLTASSMQALGSPWFLALLVVMTLSFFVWGQWHRGALKYGAGLARVMDYLIGLLPGIRGWLNQQALAVSAGSLAVTLKAAISLPEALVIAASSLRHQRLAAGLLEASRRVREGAPIVEALSQPCIPAALKVVMRHAGEDDFPRALELVSQSAKEQADVKARRISQTLFVVALLLAAAGIGTVLAQFYGKLVSMPGALL